MSSPLPRRSHSSIFHVNSFFRQTRLRIFSALLLVFALLALQQVAATHAYSHLGAALGGQATVRGDQPHALATVHACALCVAVSGVNLLSPPAVFVLALVRFAMRTLAAAVLPAPTFSFPSAYLSRAPPFPLD